MRNVLCMASFIEELQQLFIYGSNNNSIHVSNYKPTAINYLSHKGWPQSTKKELASFLETQHSPSDITSAYGLSKLSVGL